METIRRFIHSLNKYKNYRDFVFMRVVALVMGVTFAIAPFLISLEGFDKWLLVSLGFGVTITIGLTFHPSFDERVKDKNAVDQEWDID